MQNRRELVDSDVFRGIDSKSAHSEVDETSENGFYRFERRYGTFARAVGLPQGSDQDNISARYQNGVLEVRVPKPEEQKPRKIALSQTIDA